MRIQMLASGLVCVALASGQSFKTNWANNCFMNPASVVCKYHDFAIKPAKGSGKVGANMYSSTTGTPSRMVNNIDWRFADPQPDVLAGFHVSELSASPLARRLIAQLGAKQNLNEADIQKIFEGLASVDQIALSVRDNRVVVMLSGRVKELTLPPPDGDLKALTVSATTMLFGHRGAVDEAAQRIAAPASTTGPTSELTEFAAERQASSEFWATASGQLAGTEAMSDHLHRLSLALSFKDRVASDFAFEFDGPPSAKALQTWQTPLGEAKLEGNTLYASTSMEAKDVPEKFGQIVASPLGERLVALVGAAKSLPLRDLNALKETHPVIYGLEGGPIVVK
jgi:hypothetical protein